MKTIDIIAGARPNFMKIAPIISGLKAAQAQGGLLQYRLIHAGQHYDKAMSSDFFAQLGLPEPDINLEVGSGTQAEQTAPMSCRRSRLRSATTSLGEWQCARGRKLCPILSIRQELRFRRLFRLRRQERS
jgi:hypothetical protein